jgi:hypothetical protein
VKRKVRGAVSEFIGRDAQNSMYVWSLLSDYTFEWGNWEIGRLGNWEIGVPVYW